jgi:hypothetical protein
VPWGGNHGWTPVLLEIGPIPEGTDHISYGFDLQGSGNMWVYKPILEIVSDKSSAENGDLFIIGHDRR